MGLLRLFLATAVLVDHFAVLLFPGLPGAEVFTFGINGTRAVMLFFVVSGFLISYVLGSKYDTAATGTIAFYRSRFLRIYPLWWALLAVGLVLFGFNWLNQPRMDIVTTILLVGPDIRTAFVDFPHNYAAFPGFLGIGWSLASEVAFYILAPFLLRSTGLCILLFVITSASRYYVVGLYPFGDEWQVWNKFFFPHLLPFFLAGHFARLIWEKLTVDPAWGIILFLLVPAFFVASIGGPFDSFSFYAGVACFALSLPPLFALTKDNHRMNAAGDLTYPLYLSHRLFIQFILVFPMVDVGLDQHIRNAVGQLPLSPLGQFAVAALALAPAAFAIAWATHRFLERPAIRGFELLFGTIPTLTQRLLTSGVRRAA